MPCHYVIDKEQRLVISTGVGVVTFGEMKAHQDQLLRDPDFNPEFNQLIDATEVTAAKLWRGEAQEITHRNIFSVKSRRALVATKPAIFGMGRLLMTYLEMSDSPSQTNVFHDVPSALKWLGAEAAGAPMKGQDAKKANKAGK